MISTGFLIFTLILIALGAIGGFRRGIKKEGIRVGIWAILFIISCFLIPSIIEKVTVIEIEFDIVKNNSYLSELLVQLVQVLIIPIITIVFYWITGIISILIYATISIFYFRKKAKKEIADNKATEDNTESKANQKNIVFQVSGLVLGVVLALFSGMMTIYPIAQINSAIKEGDVHQTLVKEISEVELLVDAYEGTPVQMIYRFTGTEWVAGKVHSILVNANVDSKEQNIWTDLSNIVRFGTIVWDTYSKISDIENSNVKLGEELQQIVEAYFSLNFIDDENKLLLLNNLKTEIGKDIENELVNKGLNLVEFKSEEQVINDVVIYGGLFDFLKAEGILEGSSFIPTQEVLHKLLEKLYGLSNATIVVPEFINWTCGNIFAGEITQLVQPENFVLNEQTKSDISEIFDVICWVSNTNISDLSLKQKQEALNMIQKLEDNKTLGKENYEDILNYVKKKM